MATFPIGGQPELHEKPVSKKYIFKKEEEEGETKRKKSLETGRRFRRWEADESRRHHPPTQGTESGQNAGPLCPHPSTYTSLRKN